MATNPIINLDFDGIKADIIAFAKNDPTFSDYNFEGSALNTLIDILAYNTHTNAYYANMIHNEGFLDTAQKRSSVVSKAKELGYTPKSSTGSRAVVTVTMQDPQNMVPYIPQGTVFNSSNDNGSYSFLSLTDASYTISGLNKVFSNIELVEGTLVSNSFVFNTQTNIKSLFTIPNQDIDISTLRVFVKNSGSTAKTEFYVSKTVFDNKFDSNVFYIQESYDGFFQIYFGQNIIGKQPIDGNIIVVEYFVTKNKALGNGCITFYYGDSNVTTIQQSYGGNDRETIDSIKINATKTYSTKHRAVTANDYAAVIKENFGFVNSVAVWSGADNTPPVYGKVYISVQPSAGFFVTDNIKENVIKPVLKTLSILTVSPELIDPDYTYLELTTNIKFNSDKTTVDKNTISTLTKTCVMNYINSISKFETDFINLVLIQNISALDSGIISVDVSKNAGFVITPSCGIQINYSKSLNNVISLGTVESSKFNVLKDDSYITVSIKEIYGSTYTNYNNGVVETITKLGLYSDLGFVSEIGTVNLNGDFIFTLNVYSYVTDNAYIFLKCSTVDADITVKRNQILALRTDATDSLININSNNIVNIQAYDK